MFSKDLKPFYESATIKPLLHDHTVKSGESTYRVERWFWSTEGVLKSCPFPKGSRSYTKDNYEVMPERLHCYVFIDISLNTPNRKNPFAKSPSTVVELLKIKKIVITNLPY